MSLYFDYKNNLEPKKGRLLISEPHLPDFNFDRTVILLCEHSNDGSFGFVINKPSKVSLNDILKHSMDIESKVFIGGPVEQNTLHFIHRSSFDIEGEIEIAEGIYWGGDFNQILDKSNTQQLEQEDVRFFLGYSGWGVGQLEQEIEANSWIVYDMEDSNLIFDLEENLLWKTLLQDMGGRFSMYSKYPNDPRLN